MMHLFYLLMPLLFLTGFLLSFLGLIRFRTIFGIIIAVFLLGVLPGWARWIIIGLIALTLIRAILTIFVGDRDADQAVGDFAGTVLVLLFQLLLFPFRAVAWISRTALRRW